MKLFSIKSIFPKRLEPLSAHLLKIPREFILLKPSENGQILISSDEPEQSILNLSDIILNLFGSTNQLDITLIKLLATLMESLKSQWHQFLEKLSQLSSITTRVPDNLHLLILQPLRPWSRYLEIIQPIHREILVTICQ